MGTVGEHVRETRGGMLLLWEKEGCCHVKVTAWQEGHEVSHWTGRFEYIGDVQNTSEVFGDVAVRRARQAL